MSSFLWLLLYLAPLLGLTAVTFAWLGRRWRSADLQQRLREMQARFDDMQAARSAGEVAHDTLRGQAQAAEAQTELLREELQTAREEAHQGRAEATKARELSDSLKSELTRAIQELETPRTDLEKSAAALAAAHAEIERLRQSPAAHPAAPAPVVASPVPLPGTKRPRSTAPKTRITAGRLTSLADTLAAVEQQLASHQSTVGALTEERDDWQRRVTKLEAQAVADPAGLRLAYRSLADSEKRLQALSIEIERLQNQSRVLHRAQEGAAALADVADDDLTRIKGIKSVISEQLRAHGIRTWRQIAQWNEDEQRAFSELLAFKNRATREKWKEQAQALHESSHGLLPL